LVSEVLAYLQDTFYGENSGESVVEELEHFVSRVILLDGVLSRQGHTTHHYHKQNETVKERFRDEPMKAHANTETKTRM